VIDPLQHAIDAATRSDMAVLGDELQRTGSERAQAAWARIRGRFVALDQEQRRRVRSEDETRPTEVPR
jgi:hypothetical protein